MVEDLLAIAASEADMRKVLFHMAENAACFKKRETGYGFEGKVPFAKAPIEDMYNYVKQWTDDWCAPVFASLNEFNPKDYSPTIAYGSSTSQLWQWNDMFILCMRYTTEWSWNTTDLDKFFEWLPQGEYGLAIYWIEEEGSARYFRSGNSITELYLGEGARSNGGSQHKVVTSSGDIDLRQAANVAAVNWGFDGRRSSVDKYLSDFWHNGKRY